MTNKTISIYPLLTALLLACLTGCVEQPPQQNQPTSISVALQTINYLDNGNYTDAYLLFNHSVQQLMPLQQLEEIWTTLTNSYGTLTKIVTTRNTTESNYPVVYVTCRFSDQGLLDIRFVFNNKSLIIGFQFVPTDISDQYQPPTYGQTDTFTEYNITIGTGTWALPGTITIPQGNGPFPAAILVHGSGQNDRDETIGPNKPFKDLAWGLATQGIAVLRYDKRTYTHRDTFITLNNFTVQEEVLEDAQLAIELLLQTDKIDTKNIILIGHSLGGMLAPRIATNTTHLNGIILLAAPARPLHELILDQTLYLAELDGIIDENEHIQINLITQQINTIQTLNFTTNDMTLGAPPPYWKDLATYNQITTVQNLTTPLLILQGKRDYQVTYADDFSIWNNTFNTTETVTPKTYKTLNHLFMAGTGPPTNTEYNTPGNIEEAVIIDIANWIHNLNTTI